MASVVASAQRLFRRKKTRSPKIKLIHGGRTFVLTFPLGDDLPVFNGRLRPEPELIGHRRSAFGSDAVPGEAYLDFCIIQNRHRKFQGIAVPEEYQRHGWATDMVSALLLHYPHVRFRNSPLNAESGPLFMKLQRQHPETIAPIRQHTDGSFEVQR